MTKYVGFFGIEKYDVILLVSSIIAADDKKILIIDQSENNALTYAIQRPDNYDKDVVFSTRIPNVDFINSIYTSLCNKFDYVFIDFGFDVKHPFISSCQYLVLVTDQQLHNLKEFKELSNYDTENAVVVQSAINHKIDAIYLSEQLKSDKIDVYNHFYFIYEENVNTKIKLDCQYTSRISCKRASKSYKNMIFGLVEMITTGNRTSDIKKLYRQVERRKL